MGAGASRWRRALVWAGVMVATGSTAALGQQDIPRFEQTVLVTPAASPVSFEVLSRQVVVLGQAEIASLPARSVSDLLAYAQGIDVRSRGPAGVQADFSLRGAGFGQVVVLVNGVRINDAQTGHHNSDIPVPLSAIERIEVVLGAGSALYGADAVGGTINVITRIGGKGVQGNVTLGGDGYVAGEAALRAERGKVTQSLAASVSRSSGFMYDRDFAVGAISSQTRIGPGTSLLAAFTSKAFGANGFYGPSPSKEWTDQTLVSLDHRLFERARWQLTSVTSYRTHGDRFLWDIRRPGVNENRHRTHAVIGGLKVRHQPRSSTTISAGGELAAEWIVSSALGDHDVRRGSAFAELQQRFGPRVSLVGGLRYDRYSTFGGAWAPSASVSVWTGADTKVRAGVGRTFRVPTFTERFYRDPAHQGTPTLDPEKGWEAEVGTDRVWRGGWGSSATLFRRAERDLIDWSRPNTAATWRTANLRRVTTRGLELSTRGPIGGGHSLGVQYSFVDLDAAAPTALLKYSHDYARHLAAASLSLALPGRLTLVQRAGFTHRVDRRQARVWDARLSRPVGRVTLTLEGTNLLDERYQETRGVDMPGRWLKVGATFALQ